MDSMKSRILTSVIAIPAVILALILCDYHPWVLSVALSIVCVLMSYEALSARKLHKNIPLISVCILFSFAVPVLINTSFSFLLFYVFAIILCFLMIIKNDVLSLGDITYTFFTHLILTLGLSSILMLSNVLQGYTAFSFVLCVAIPWMADSGAYFAGVFLGKHKLCPKISPKKSVEGFVGGLIVGTLSSLLIGLVFSLIYKDVSFNYINLLILGFLGSIISVVGDLTFSIVKRSCNIKDYGSLFPGHGGMLDRFDSVLLVAPLVCVYCTYFNVILV